ncbi:ribonucleoside hydrolase RihC [Sporosarcina pasteurii]|uniref:Non-specific ribonucleoside hydrolase rihC n=1 Tax=Sporosarcina pasteurii TaxID=1474 RepID=A0A380BI67_SPOPA|nr:ribonucleoside hydrolase RihC [Sporosarcina pasteurii]MDS9470710.1 ribonucleoside hydrolase RihC [Sporosarcina pasteurii]QBQ05608.1 ribonucleoside hydrolase RihC [Sporosarcina pasteurii]SUJ01694.1 Non-specific ribonucleoside hydrolase rihC [Sporosarcina pasteurii]
MKRIPIIIDTDPGIDDAAAIGLALYRDDLEVKLITTVAGNVDIDNITTNALKLVTFFDKDIPVARGMDTPLLKPALGNKVHGVTGMDGYDFPQPTRRITNKHAVEAMRSLLEESEEKITIVPIGPLTNIAVLLLMYPQLKSKIESIVLMGGSLSGGNVNGAAEFNMWADPHAAKMVFDSGLDIVMIGLDVTLKARIGEEILSKSSNKSADMFNAIFRHYIDGDMDSGVVMHDSCAIAYLTNPELFTIERRLVEVVTDGPAGGMTMELFGKEETNVSVAVGIDSEAFQDWFLGTLNKMI